MEFQTKDERQLVGRKQRKTSLPIHNIPGHLTLHSIKGNTCQNRGGKCTYKQ